MGVLMEINYEFFALKTPITSCGHFIGGCNGGCKGCNRCLAMAATVAMVAIVPTVAMVRLLFKRAKTPLGKSPMMQP